MNKEQKPKAEIKEPRCPLNSTLKCSECRWYQFFSKDAGKMCALIYSAMRS